MKNRKVAVAMSGGVDSSVAALILREAGYDVVGITMRLSGDYDVRRSTGQQGCCSLDDVDDARKVCQIIDIPHYLLNFEREFQSHVIEYFLSEYQMGRTPNPCLACNDRIKFDFLLHRAQALGVDQIATGHYARLDYSNNSWKLRKAVTPLKDQSYVLFNLRQDEMARLLLPVGWYTKEEIRRMASQANLPVADKPDSQEICFIQGDYRDFVRERVEPHPGEIVDVSGNVLGGHPGIEFFTVGQRRGIGIAGSEPLYVIEIETSSGRVIVGRREDLLRSRLWAARVNYISGLPPAGPVEIETKIRYGAKPARATLTPLADCMAQVQFHEAQFAITPGQAVVFYQGDEVLGGGMIESNPPGNSSEDRLELEAIA